MIKHSVKCDNVKYAVRDILSVANEAKKKGLPLRYLNIGDPLKFDHSTPAHMINAIHNAMLNGENGYCPSNGTEEAIESVRNDAKRKNITNIHDIFITSGASEAIELALTALLDPGDNILTPFPGYPLYTAVLAKLDVQENPYFLDEENEWMPDPEDIRKKINSKTKAIVIINPNNPTGSLCSKEVLMEIVKIAEEKNLLVLCDEIYDRILYDGKEHISLASLNPELPVITFNGVSKSYVAPGFRIGWGIISGNKQKLSTYIEALNKLLRARLCACTPVMASVKAALDGPQDHLVSLMKKMTIRRDMTWKMLNAIEGISCVKPEGAFYAFPKIEVKDDADFVKHLIMETGVVVVPGSGFGQKPGTQHFRVVFLPEEEILKDAYTKIGTFMNKWRNL
ncbi:MAG: aminotransferase class I/II-fold pyridoxal phosphate-dependent enzyme [bacterium]